MTPVRDALAALRGELRLLASLRSLPFVDSSHERDPTVAAFGAWRDALARGAIVVFHDYDNPDFPGVREAVALLELSGHVSGGLFVWRAP